MSKEIISKCDNKTNNLFDACNLLYRFHMMVFKVYHLKDEYIVVSRICSYANVLVMHFHNVLSMNQRKTFSAISSILENMFFGSNSMHKFFCLTFNKSFQSSKFAADFQFNLTFKY